MKYCRTYHLGWSEGVTSDDKTLKNVSHFEGKQVIVTLKMDGENSGLSKDNCHARSLDSKDHPSRHWLKGLWGNIRYDIPEHMKIFGENVFAKHSIEYDNLESYFYVFNILMTYEDSSFFLSWDEVKEWCELLQLNTVPVLYEGIWDEEKIKNLYQETYNGNVMEGYVVRLRDSFEYKDSSKSLAKFVRKNHVTTTTHWMFDKITPNKLKPSNFGFEKQ